MTRELWTLPVSWDWSCAGELGDIVTGATPPTDNDDYFNGKTPFFKPADLNAGYFLSTARESLSAEGVARARLLPAQSVLVICIGATIGKTALTRVNGTTNQQINAILPGRGIALPEWIYWWFASPMGQDLVKSNASATTLPILNKGRFAELAVPVAPIGEQRRIVAKTETLTAKSRRAKEALDAIPALLERFRQSVLAAAFRGDLTADWREKNPDVEPAEELLRRIRAERRRRWEEAELAKMRAKGKVPGDDRWKERYEEPSPAALDGLHDEWFPAQHEQNWEVSSLEAACDPMRGIPYGIVLTGDPDAAGVPTVRCGDIRNFRIDISGLKRVTRKVAEDFVRTRLDGNEVLIAIRGTVGATAVATDAMRGMNISREVAMIPLLPGIEPRFVMYLLASPGGQALLSRHIKGVAQAGINLSDLRAFPLSIPPLAEQREILNQVDRILQRIETLTRELVEAGARHALLDRAVLAKAFRGELVPQDSNDEPASVLLERLRAEVTSNGQPTDGARRPRRPAPPESSKPSTTGRGRKPATSSR
ncbi:restriction endonuclease subunit S [Sorangium sp. So ce269]